MLVAMHFIYSFIYDLCVKSKSFGTESFVARPENMYVSIIDEEKTLMERFDEKKSKTSLGKVG
jgi:hypothetical protein